MGKLIDDLIDQGYLKTPAISGAFRKISRADFAPDDLVKKEGREFIEEYNAPLSIGFGQTVSQPQTVALMLELLQPEKGNKILDIGSGSGWQTALLAEVVGPSGFVYAIERIRELKEFGQKNVAKYGFTNVEFVVGDGSKGMADQAPFDRIVAAAAVDPIRNFVSNGADEIPLEWKKQLKVGGRLVAPVGSDIWLLVKKAPTQGRGPDSEEVGKFEEKRFPGFAFVPLVKGN